MNWNNYQQNQGVNYNYNQKVPVPKMSQGLTAQEIAELRKNAAEFTLKPTPREILASRCTHRMNGEPTLIDNNDGSVTCTICGETFNLIDKVEDAEEITAAFISLLQSIKSYYLDMPEDYIKELFQPMPILKKMPKLFEVALKDFHRYNRENDIYQNGGGRFAFNTLQAIGASPMGAGFGYPQPQPQYGMNQQYGAPMGGYPQPQQQGGFPGFNPAMNGQYQQQQYGAPMGGGYQPQPGYPPVQPGANPLTSDGGTASGYGTPSTNGQKVNGQSTVSTTKQFSK